MREGILPDLSAYRATGEVVPTVVTQAPMARPDLSPHERVRVQIEGSNSSAAAADSKMANSLMALFAAVQDSNPEQPLL